MIKVFKVISVELLNLDLTLHKHFGTINQCSAYLGTKIGSLSRHQKHKGKRSPYLTVKHRTTKIKYYVKVITEIDN